MINLLKQIFSYAMSQRLCFSNPAEYILYEDYEKNCNHDKKSDEERAFSEAECKMLHDDALHHANNPRALMRLLSMETGLRVGELSALQWDDILEEFIHVHRQQICDKSSGHQVFYDVEYTKDERRHNHGGRYVPRTAEVNKVLELAKKLDGESAYIFHDKKGKPISKDSYEQNLRRACDKLGIDTSNNHAFRIAFNSKLIEKGLSPADRALILGHAVQTNEHHYSVSDKRRLDDIRQKLM
jgi:integrase